MKKTPKITLPEVAVSKGQPVHLTHIQWKSMHQNEKGRTKMYL